MAFSSSLHITGSCLQTILWLAPHQLTCACNDRKHTPGKIVCIVIYEAVFELLKECILGVPAK